MKRPHPGFTSVMVVLARLHRIADRLRGGKSWTARALAVEEEVSVKTISRTMEFFRYSLGWDLEASQQGYRLLREGTALIKIRKGELR